MSTFIISTSSQDSNNCSNKQNQTSRIRVFIVQIQGRDERSGKDSLSLTLDCAIKLLSGGFAEFAGCRANTSSLYECNVTFIRLQGPGLLPVSYFPPDCCLWLCFTFHWLTVVHTTTTTITHHQVATIDICPTFAQIDSFLWNFYKVELIL